MEDPGALLVRVRAVHRGAPSDGGRRTRHEGTDYTAGGVRGGCQTFDWIMRVVCAMSAVLLSAVRVEDERVCVEGYPGDAFLLV